MQGCTSFAACVFQHDAGLYIICSMCVPGMITGEPEEDPFEQARKAAEFMAPPTVSTVSSASLGVFLEDDFHVGQRTEVHIVRMNHCFHATNTFCGFVFENKYKVFMVVSVDLYICTSDFS